MIISGTYSPQAEISTQPTQWLLDEWCHQGLIVNQQRYYNIKENL